VHCAKREYVEYVARAREFFANEIKIDYILSD